MVKLVIYIEESDRDAISYMGLHRVRPEVLDRVGKAIAYGQTLPQGHGRLLDEKDVIKSLFDYIDGKKTIGQCIDDTSEILEADTKVQRKFHN